MSNTGTIQHVVVLMLENRSYDNVLGWLYGPGNAAPYATPPPFQAELNGLVDFSSDPGGVGKNLSNPNPTAGQPAIKIANQTTNTQLGGSGPTYPPTTIPIVDPGEVFVDMAQQYIGGDDRPDSNPYGPPLPALTMQGFTLNYARHGGALGQGHPPVQNYPDVMNHFTPAQLPTTAMLANQYAVCDAWYASAPTQTFTNRAFSQTAAPSVGIKHHLLGKNSYYSLIDDIQYHVDYVSMPSVFQQLDLSQPASSGPQWRVYFHDYSISRLTVPYVLDTAKSSGNDNVAMFDDSDWPGTSKPDWLHKRPATTFLEDAASGSLPPFAFIEPRYSNSYPDAVQGLAPNSNHPGPANYPLNPNKDDNPPIDAASGEALLQQVYDALTASPCWGSTLFIVTYDEPGGTYDHVTPPGAKPPGTVNWPTSVTTPPFSEVPAVGDTLTADGFGFNLYGGRVPTLVISPHVTPQSTITAPAGKPPFDHASIVRTVWDIFNLSARPNGMPSLTQRDLKAPSLVPFLIDTIVTD